MKIFSNWSVENAVRNVYLLKNGSIIFDSNTIIQKTEKIRFPFFSSSGLNISIIHMEYLFLPLILFELLGDFTLYKGSRKDEYIYVLYAIIIYSINIIIYFYLLKYYKNLAIVNGIWQGLMLFMITMISIFYFKDKFEYNHIMGLMFIFIGIFLLNYKS